MKVRPAGRRAKANSPCWRDTTCPLDGPHFAVRSAPAGACSTTIVHPPVASARITINLLHLPMFAALTYFTAFLSLVALALGGVARCARRESTAPWPTLTPDPVEDPYPREGE